MHHSLAKRHTNCHQIWKKLGPCIPWRRNGIVRHYLNSMTGSRTKQRHMWEWNCPLKNRESKIATYLLMSLKRRPELKFLRPSAPVKHRQWETKTIDPLVVLLVKKNTPYGAVHCFAKKCLHNGKNCLQITNSVFHAGIGNIRSAKAQNHASAWIKDAQALTIPCFMAPNEVSTKNLEKSNESNETSASSVTVVTNKTEESPGMPSVTNVKGLLQITEVKLQSSFHIEKVLVLGDSACSNS